MDLTQLRYAVALAEEASFSRAAVRLGIAQPSLSQQIKKLETELGQPLFDRLPRRVVPTAAGELLLEHARRVLNELADARRRISDQAHGGTEPLRIGVIPTIAPFLLPRVLEAFTCDANGIELEVVEDVTANLLQTLAAGEVDLAIISEVTEPMTVHVETIGYEPMHVLLSSDHPLAERKALTWPALRDQRWLVLHEMHCLSGQVMKICQEKRIKRTIAVRGSQLSTIARLASAGLGLSLVPQMMAAQDHNDDRVYRPLRGAAPRRPIAVAWSLLRYRTQLARRFVDVLRQVWREKV